MGAALSEGVVDEFVSSYIREFDYYQVAARLCAARCEALLAERGIRAIVSSRAKRPQKLQSKLRQRDQSKKYKSISQIRDDIPDLAGVRIALYFPGDRDRVGILVRENFDVDQEKRFPSPSKKRPPGKRFEGYYADHFRITLPDSTLDEGQKAYLQARIEIQVGSVLMHAWAEVEHDLVYKPESGSLSDDEHAILDELNGLVLAGEIALERLQRAVERRLSTPEADSPFESHYELAAFLDKWSRLKFGEEQRMGRVDILWSLIKAADLDSVQKLQPILNEVEQVPDQALADQIADAALATRPDLYSLYASLQSSLSFASSGDRPQNSARTASIGKFLAAWIVVERTFSRLAEERGLRRSGIVNVPGTAKEMGLPGQIVEALLRVRQVRNQLVHGIEIPSPGFLDQVTAELQSVIDYLSEHDDGDIRTAAKDAGFGLAAE